MVISSLSRETLTKTFHIQRNGMDFQGAPQTACLCTPHPQALAQIRSVQLIFQALRGPLGQVPDFFAHSLIRKNLLVISSHKVSLISVIRMFTSMKQSKLHLHLFIYLILKSLNRNIFQKKCMFSFSTILKYIIIFKIILLVKYSWVNANNCT